jgi:hypothetical protein
VGMGEAIFGSGVDYLDNAGRKKKSWMIDDELDSINLDCTYSPTVRTESRFLPE